jgi:hypothetical protein
MHRSLDHGQIFRLGMTVAVDVVAGRKPEPRGKWSCPWIALQNDQFRTGFDEVRSVAPFELFG